MFTGLVKSLGRVLAVRGSGGGARLGLDLGPDWGQVTVGESIAVNGVCLTVAAARGVTAEFDAVAETLSRTNLGRLRPGDAVNLEPALRVGSALDGHFLLGHVDAVAAIREVAGREAEGRRVTVELPAGIRRLVAEKGSIAIDGISLTVAAVGAESFSVAVIPHSWRGTTLGLKKKGEAVNLEADVLARYAARLLACGEETEGGVAGGVTEELLRRSGFA